jgi:hypothetical protein
VLPIREIGGVGKFYISENSLLPFPDRKGDRILKGVATKRTPLRTIKRQLPGDESSVAAATQNLLKGLTNQKR